MLTLCINGLYAFGNIFLMVRQSVILFAIKNFQAKKEQVVLAKAASMKPVNNDW